MKLKKLEWKRKNIHNGWSILTISTAVGNFAIDSRLSNRHDKWVLSKIVDDRYVPVDSSSDLDALKYYVESLHVNYMNIIFDKFAE